jgi:hypothetical protein
LNETGTPKRLLHLIDVQKIGGVERMFANFVAHPPLFPVQHFTVAYPAIAPTIREVILRHSQFFSIRKFSGLRLPKWPRVLRTANRERLIRKLRPDLILVWNQFVDVRAFLQNARWPCPVLYYEHGNTWYEQTPALVEAFFRHVDGVIAVSQAAKRMLQLKYQITQPIDVCLNVLRLGVLPVESSTRRCWQMPLCG